MAPATLAMTTGKHPIREAWNNFTRTGVTEFFFILLLLLRLRQKMQPQKPHYKMTTPHATDTKTPSAEPLVSESANTALPVKVHFSVNRHYLVQTDEALLVWEVENAAEVSISPNIGRVARKGSQAVSPTQTTVYSLTALNHLGQGATHTVRLAVFPLLTLKRLEVPISATVQLGNATYLNRALYTPLSVDVSKLPHCEENFPTLTPLNAKYSNTAPTVKQVRLAYGITRIGKKKESQFYGLLKKLRKSLSKQLLLSKNSYNE